MSAFSQNYQLKVQLRVGSDDGMASKEEVLISESDSFAGLENFGSFMVSESFNDDLRIK